MEEEHRQAIIKNFTSLVNQTSFDIMRDALIEKGIFTDYMIARYANLTMQPIEKNRVMYHDIMRRGPRAFGILLEALEENGYWDLVRMLDPDTTLNTISNPRPTGPYSTGEKEPFLSLTNRRKILEKKQLTDQPVLTTPTVPRATMPQNQENIPLYVVTKSTKFTEDNPSNDIRLYRTRSRKRGVLVILSYMNFNGIEAYRAGADVDSTNLKYLFSEIGFKVLAFQDLTYKETLNTLNEMKRVLEPGLESVFIVVSSHGHERSGSSDTDIRCHDGMLISLYQIIEYFSNSSMPELRDVPKVFIFQNCRGKDETFIEDSKHSSMTPPPPLTMPEAEIDGTPFVTKLSPSTKRIEKMALYTNILVVQSTLPGFVSRRDPKEGSWYIQVLCEVFAERAHDCHVDKLFTMVDERLQERFRVQTSSVDRWGFNRRLYLHPGLFQ